MKHALLHMPSWDIKGILIEDHEDFLEYTNFSEKEIEVGIRAIFKSPEPMDRWDHICIDPSLFSGLFKLSFIDAKFNGGNPLLKIDDVLNRKYRTMIGLLLKGEKIIINSVGGYCCVGDNPYTILPDQDFEPVLSYFIPKNEKTTFINLENDPEIEEYTRTHLKKLDANYSFVKNMIHWRKEDFEKVFNEFKEKGGQGIWVYTTGMDVNQMYLYTKTAIKCGLTKLVFIFNSGKTANLIDFVEEIEKYNPNIEIDVTYL